MDSSDTGTRQTGGLPKGARLGRYELIRKLGSGGMAEVHLARSAGIEGFQKLVVLKRILPHIANDPDFIRMFLAEARLVAMLDHPNIAQVFDLGREGDDYYFVMEFVDGENVQSILRTARKQPGPFQLPHALSIAIGTAAGLHCAHESVGLDREPLSIVHRDISPTNILVTHDGHVKIVDFGIAKVVNRTDYTRAGTRKGKVPYMSPEQCQGHKLDRRSDIFSLGIVLYEMTTLRRLFKGENEFAIMKAIVDGAIRPPSIRNPDYPAGLEAIVMKALATDPDDRYQTALEFQVELEQFARKHNLATSAPYLGGTMWGLFGDTRKDPLDLSALRMDPVRVATAAPSAVTLADRNGTDSGTAFSPGRTSAGDISSISGTAAAGNSSTTLAPPPVMPAKSVLVGVAVGLAVATVVLGSAYALFQASQADATTAPPAAAHTPTQGRVSPAPAPVAEVVAEAEPDPDPESVSAAPAPMPAQPVLAEKEEKAEKAEKEEEPVFLDDPPDDPPQAKSEGETNKPTHKKKKKKKDAKEDQPADPDVFLPG